MNEDIKKKNIGVCLFVILGLCSIGISGAVGLIEVAAPTIQIDINGTGAANASICVTNHSRLVYVWCENAPSDTVITLGKDGLYLEFGASEQGYLIMGISPRWNQTVEISVHCDITMPFDVWGTVVAGSIWRDGGWQLDNPDQPDQNVILATVSP